ncbi:hypothetical protein SAMN04489712_106269 [Thermomonospora echinospora]|uniref:Uncharacterized protein n=1 Tax=Thermomonospora echinospora TaxID=1992 RepID=A0A1H6B5K3_9ACTN|nr:hypothetical protein [Thermomonospora echinospora]SEG55902.1 hypothetical protein SAMN04489712_106269 [Thermomonospora echinospora]
MTDPNGKSHIAHASLDGPAERTLIEPWLTEYAGLMTNAYPDERPRAAAETHRLATVTALDPQPTPPARTVLAA